MSRTRNKPTPTETETGEPAAAVSRARPRAREPIEGDDDWRPVGPNGSSRVRFARDDFTGEQLAAFMRALEDGVALDVASRTLGESVTASRVRAYRRREPAFDALVAEAVADGKLAYQDRLRTRSRQIATDRENPSPRILEVELATHVPEYAHLRRDRLRVDGNVRHEFAVAFDPAALAALPVERLRELQAILADLDGDIVVEGNARSARELAAGDG